LEKYLGLSRGAVSPFGLVNDNENHVHVFIDEGLKTADMVTFHPNTNNATLKISFNDFLKFMDHSGNSYEFVEI
ncbi:MAG: prolyl-tRNA synthetase associated domain-containing protein, partial [Bacteroidales bacterium]|nr:prolyl-tRNA synthetase associated domain-containing protein [Bacteroidales bacterium]